MKQRLPNASGLYDLHGNVWEWCRDLWKSDAYAARAGGAADPVLDSGDRNASRVVRGGSWNARARSCRAAFRHVSPPGDDWFTRGFRLAAGQELPAAEPQGAERPLPERRSRG